MAVSLSLKRLLLLHSARKRIDRRQYSWRVLSVCTVVCTQARLQAMEGKILKGAARGGLVELTRVKEEHLKRREEELQRRWVGGCTTAQHTAQQIYLVHAGRMAARLNLRRRQPQHHRNRFCCACHTTTPSLDSTGASQ
jgi:hypothetical protein